jgi:hypothetical protein
MRTGPTVVLAFAMVALAGALSILEAQRPTVWVMPATREAASERAGPFSRLLDHEAELELSPAQVREIREIQARLVRQNEPLIAQVRDAEVWGVDSDAEEVALAAVRERLRENVEAAELEIREALTPEQLERARELLEGPSLADAADADDIEPPADQDEARIDRAEPSATVMVENFNFYDANIYAISGARRQRLGFSTGLGTQSFTIPASVLAGSGEVRFEVRPIGRADFPLTETVIVNPGDVVMLRVPPG